MKDHFSNRLDRHTASSETELYSTVSCHLCKQPANSPLPKPPGNKLQKGANMRMPRPVILICMLLLPIAVFADNTAPAPDSIELLYTPPANSSVSQNIKVDLLDVTLEGASTYMTGTASAKVLLQFGEPPPGDSATVMTVTVSNMQGQAMGEQRTVTEPEVIQVTVDQQARVVRYQVKKRPSTPIAIASGDALTALAIFAVLPRLPAEPVVVGTQWHWRQVVTFPEIGQATADMQCRLIDISEEQIVIESSGKVTMPEVQLPNPFDPSGTMKATDFNITVTRLRQVCQPDTLVVSEAQCEATATFTGVQPDYTLPLGMKFKFSVQRPLPPTAE